MNNNIDHPIRRDRRRERRQKTRKRKLICPNCKSEIKERQLFCLNCAQQKADEELERIALLRFQTGTYALGLTGSHHLVPGGANVLTLCREHRFKKPNTERFFLWNLTNEPKKKLCEKCKAKAMQTVEATK